MNSKEAETSRSSNVFRQAREVKEAANSTALKDEIEVHSYTLDSKDNKNMISTALLDKNLNLIEASDKLQENKPPGVIHDYDEVKSFTVSIADNCKPIEHNSKKQEETPVVSTFDLRKYKNATPDVVNHKDKDLLSNYSTTFDKHLERQEKDKESRRVIHMRKERMNLWYYSFSNYLLSLLAKSIYSMLIFLTEGSMKLLIKANQGKTNFDQNC